MGVVLTGSPVKLCVLLEENIYMLFDVILPSNNNAIHSGLWLVAYSLFEYLQANYKFILNISTTVN